jgi:hypothetical protein
MLQVDALLSRECIYTASTNESLYHRDINGCCRACHESKRDSGLRGPVLGLLGGGYACAHNAIPAGEILEVDNGASPVLAEKLDNWRPVKGTEK